MKYHRLTSDHATSTEHPPIDRRALDNGTNHPQDTRDLQGKLARVLIRDERTAQRPHQTARRHRGRDAALGIADRIVEVILVCARAQHATHGADIEAEERSAYGVGENTVVSKQSNSEYCSGLQQGTGKRGGLEEENGADSIPKAANAHMKYTFVI